MIPYGKVNLKVSYPRSQVSVYRTIGLLVKDLMHFMTFKCSYSQAKYVYK